MLQPWLSAAPTRPGRPRPMPLSLTIDRVDRTPTGGFAIQCNGGNFNKEFASVAELLDFTTDIMDEDRLARIAFAHWLTKSADASDDSLIEGVTFEFDPAQNL